jgi:hypothetical protein
VATWEKTSNMQPENSDYIARIKQEILKMHLSRLTVFADVVNRFERI